MLSAIVWLWACTGTALIYAATPVEPQQDGPVAPTPLAIISAEPAKSAIVTAVASEITVDGALNEEAWRTAPTVGDLTQREPRTGEKPTEHTEVTLLHDANYLYIGVMAYDSEPQRIIGTQMARDANLRSDDRIEILLDTYRDQRNAFYFATNPAGALVDGLLFTNGQSNMNWDAIWTVRTLRTDQGWSAEFAIPFKSLSFPSGRTVWGFNVARYIQRKLEDDRWSGARLETQFFQVSEAGEITNPDDLTQGVGVDVRPFVGARWLHRSGNDDTTITGKPGLDVFYNLTPSLKLSATVNTDFGETEVDARQINLTRFSLFFPEKRTFFLENAGVFSFSETAITTVGANLSTCCQVIPFFSRQIGLLAGAEVPIDAGVKLTGRVGRTDVGVLDVRTRDVSTVPAKNFLVGRVKQNFLQQSYIGAIFTDGDPGLSIGSRTYGADVRLATSDFLGKAKNLNFNAYGLRSMNTGTSNKDGSYGVSVDYPNDFIDMEFAWREVQDNFRPGLGFVSRRNVRVLRAGGRVHPRSEKFPLNIRDYVHGAYYTRFTRLDNGLVESSKLHLAILDWHFRSGDAIHALFSPAISYERVFVPFEISPGVVLPPGEYRFTRFRTIVISAAKRRLAGGRHVALRQLLVGACR